MCTVHFAYSTTFIYIHWRLRFIPVPHPAQALHTDCSTDFALSSFCTILFSCVFFLSGRQPDCLTGHYSGKFVYISDRGRMCVCACVRTVHLIAHGIFRFKFEVVDAACDQPLVTLSLHTISTFKMDTNFSRLFLCCLIQLIAFSRFAPFFKSIKKRLCTVVYLNAFINSKLIFISVPNARNKYFFNSLHMG